MKNRFENLTLPIKQQVETYGHLTFAAGFPPYVRGYTAAEHLLHPVIFEPMGFKIEENHEEIIVHPNTFLVLKNEENILFEQVAASRLHRAKELFKNEQKTSEHVQLLYVSDDKNYLNIAQLRAIRMFWAKIMYDFQIPQKLPLCVWVQTPIQKYFAIMAGVRKVFYLPQQKDLFVENEAILLENSMLLKSIDPWAGSQVIEAHTQNCYVKLEEKFAQLGS